MGQVPTGGDALSASPVDAGQLEENRRYQEQLQAELVQAKFIYKEALRKQRIINLPFSASVMRTLRQFRKPKPLTQDVICAFFLLLGEPEAKTRVLPLLDSLLTTSALYSCLLIEPAYLEYSKDMQCTSVNGRCGTTAGSC